MWCWIVGISTKLQPHSPPCARASMHQHAGFLEKHNKPKQKKNTTHTHIKLNLWIMGYGYLVNVLCALFSAKLDVLSGVCFHIQTTPRDAPSPAGRFEKINTAIITEERHKGHVWHDKPQMDISSWPCMSVCMWWARLFMCLYPLFCVIWCDLCFTSTWAPAPLCVAVGQRSGEKQRHIEESRI